ncbi:MAG: aminoacyl-tRNA hydrolase [Actinomycetota bacterium]|nr:aminoacyl-tRNA hydrolase [Actinomycetota bacterium]
MGLFPRRRQTTLNVDGADRFLRVSSTCRIALSELDWRFGPSGGPGGQHANRSNTRAEIRFDVAGSPSLGPRQRARLLERIGPSVRVVADDERSQLRNRELALERLKSRLADALRVQPVRQPTRTPRSVERKRLEGKRRRADVKRLRAKPPPFEH